MYGLIDTSTLTDIADAIRGKLGVQTQYKPGQMPEAIESISSGGITPTGTKSITANGTYDVAAFASAEVDVPTGITPTGTKQVSITQNGVTTEDVTNYADAEITVNVVNQDYVGALTALGVTEDLTDSIEALTTYANGVTGESDTNLSDAVHSLGSGYGGGSGLEYEEGTYTAVSDGNPTISFTNSHSTAPALVVFVDADSYVNQIAGILYSFVDLTALFGQGVEISSTTTRNAFFGFAKIGSNGVSGTGFKSITTISDHVTSTGFNPQFDVSTVTCKSGKTYKWIAIWR